MKVVRVHNPNGLMATKLKGRKTMATRKRKTVTRRHHRRARAAVNPRRRRSHARRRNPGIVRRRRRSVAATNPRHRHHRRRRNPSALRVGQILKDMIYGAGGAILTRTAASIAGGFIPSAFAGNAFAGPVLQAGLAVTLVRWSGKKFLGQSQGDIMMLGGLISAGLDAADKFLPNIQGQLTGILRAPVQIAPTVAAQQAALAGYSDVEEVQGFADVEDVQLSEFGSY